MGGISCRTHRVTANMPASRFELPCLGHSCRSQPLTGTSSFAETGHSWSRDPVIVTAADACAVRRAEEGRAVLRSYAETHYGAKSWNCQRRVAARIEASTLGMDIRYALPPPEHTPSPLILIDAEAPHSLRLGLSRRRSAARHRSRAQACADIAHAAVPPKPLIQPVNPKSPSIPTR
jgi:hypothetical protein